MRKPASRLNSWTLATFVGLVAAALASPAHALPPFGSTTAGITDASRDADTYGDFLRAIWVSPGTQVTYLGRNDSSVKNLRAFFTATTFVSPAVTVDQYLALVGNYYPSGQDLVLMRCKPSTDQHQALSPILATWPNVFAAITNDFQGSGYPCPPNPADGNNVMFCAAQGYQDSQQAVFVTGLSTVLTSANEIFLNSSSSPGALALKRNYGIYPAFTGLGFTVAGSGTVATMSTTQVLRESILPEYLLENLSLAEAGCRCIQVPQYGNSTTPDVRHTKPIDPNYVWQKGKLSSGSCHLIRKLAVMMSTDPSAAADSSSSDRTEEP
jgi:hypothetical protein